jgi:hypothetical protein
MLGVGYVLLGRVLQTAGRRSLGVWCAFFVASFCSCVESGALRRLCCRATGDKSVLNARLLFLRSGACSLLLGGLMHGFEVHVGRGTYYWRVACVGLARTSGVGSSGAWCPACPSISPPCGCAWPPADKRALTSKHARGAPGGVRGERGVALPPVTRDIVEAACREVAEEQPRRFRLSAY